MKKIFDLYVFSNFHVALSVTALATITSLNLDLPLNVVNLSLVFFATLFAYHFIRFFENFYRQNVNFEEFIRGYSKADLGIILVSLSAILFLVTGLTSRQIFLMLPAGLLTFLYAVPVISYQHKKLTVRQLPRVKIFVIALVWTIVSVGMINGSLKNSWSFWVECIQRFVFVVAITIPFDIRDYNRDKPFLKTIPQEMGLEKAKKLAILLMVVFFVLIFFKNPLTSPKVLSELVVFGLSLILIYFTNPKKSLYYTAFWVEAIPVFWLLFLFLGQRYIG